MKSEMELKPKWAVVDEKGNRVAIFRTKLCAEQNLSKLKLNKYEELKIIEI